MSADNCVTHCINCNKEYGPMIMAIGIKYCTDCGYALTPRRCTRCHEIKPVKTGFYNRLKNMKFETHCRTCRVDTRRDLRALRTEEKVTDMHAGGRRRLAKKAKAVEDAAKHLERIKNETTLTEAEWRGTSVYFNGCALCGETHVEARFPWRTPEEGGKYVKHNMIPLCGKCTKAVPSNKEPLHWLLHTTTVTEERVAKLYAFLLGVPYE